MIRKGAYLVLAITGSALLIAGGVLWLGADALESDPRRPERR